MVTTNASRAPGQVITAPDTRADWREEKDMTRLRNSRKVTRPFVGWSFRVVLQCRCTGRRENRLEVRFHFVSVGFLLPTDTRDFRR